MSELFELMERETKLITMNLIAHLIWSVLKQGLADPIALYCKENETCVIP